MNVVAFLLQGSLVIFSLLAVGFWMSSATGHTLAIFPPWRASRPVLPVDLPAYQAKFNARAAGCAAVAAVAQALLFMFEHHCRRPREDRRFEGASHQG
jgi:hypothetical protein